MKHNSSHAFKNFDYYENEDETSLFNEILFNDPYCILISKRINDKNKKKVKKRVKVSA